jgi:hypothetical protein
MSRIDVLSERLIEFTAKAASKIRYDQRKLMAISGPSLHSIASQVIMRVANQAVIVRNGLLYCKLCRKGPFTKRGMYLHLVRVHRYELKVMITEELTRELRHTW